MKRLRILVGVLALVVFVGFVGGRQQPDDIKFKPRPSLPQGWKKLGLTDEQRNKVYKVQIDYRDRMAALEQKIKELRAEENQELLKILTDAQKARLKELKDEKAGLPPKGEPVKKEEPKKDDKKPKPDEKK